MAISLLTFKLKVTSIIEYYQESFSSNDLDQRVLIFFSGKLYLEQIFSTRHQRILRNCILNQYLYCYTKLLRERKKTDFKLPQNTAG